MTDKAIIYDVKNHIARLAFNRLGLDPDAAQTLKEICAEINGNNDIYVVLITGSGSIFCRGGQKDTEGAAAAIAAIDRPVIAAVNGEASGTGFEIALAADIRLASDNAVFCLPQIKDGRLPSDGGTQRLPRIIGKGLALELLMTAEPVNAARALEMGLVSRVASPADLSAEAQKLAETVAAKGPLALRYLKEAIIKGMDMTLEQGLRLEADLYFLLHTTSDRTEGIRSFQEKRPPKYEGK